MKITCETKDTLELSELTDFQGELKHRTKEDVQKIITSIEKFGFATPFFVWSHDGINHVLDGHGRLLALRKMKSAGEDIPPLPIVHVDCADEEHAKKLLLRITSQYGEMTSESVLEFMEGLELEVDEIALPEGVLNIDFPQADEDTSEDDEVPEVQDEAVSQLGEMYELGDSILMCGDSTNEEDVARLMNGQKADMVFTDPPYGMNLDTDYSKMNGSAKNTEFAQRKNVVDGKKYEQGMVDEFHPEFIQLIFKFFDYCKEVFLWGADYFTEYLEDRNGGSWIVWDKRDNSEQFDKMYGSSFELCWSKNKHKRELARIRWCGVFGTETEFDKKRHHPTQKPIKLVQWFLNKYGSEDDIVVDLFGGSGSTLLACEMSNRKCRTMEIDPKYCDVIRRRYTQWAKENGKPLTSGCLE